MGIEVKWLEEPHILLFQLHPPFTWKELNQALDHSIQLVNGVPEHTVGTVLDVKGIISVPKGSIDRGMKLLRKKPDNAGPVVLIQAHPAIKAFCGVIRVLHPANGKLIHFAESRQSGVSVLRRVLKIKS